MTKRKTNENLVQMVVAFGSLNSLASLFSLFFFLRINISLFQHTSFVHFGMKSTKKVVLFWLNVRSETQQQQKRVYSFLCRYDLRVTLSLFIAKGTSAVLHECWSGWIIITSISSITFSFCLFKRAQMNENCIYACLFAWIPKKSLFFFKISPTILV